MYGNLANPKKSTEFRDIPKYFEHFRSLGEKSDPRDFLNYFVQEYFITDEVKQIEGTSPGCYATRHKHEPTLKERAPQGSPRFPKVSPNFGNARLLFRIHAPRCRRDPQGTPKVPKVTPLGTAKAPKTMLRATFCCGR